MKTPYFHGSSILIDGPLKKGSYVTREKCYAAIYAHRRARGESYIYILLLEPESDVKQTKDAAGTVDWVLVRDTPFSERIPVTDKLIDECKATSPANELAAPVPK